MKFISTVVTAVALLVVGLSSLTAAFQQRPSSRSFRPSSRVFADPQQLTEYMAKAHEEKLRAVKQAEEKKNAEIEKLKNELKTLKSAPGALAMTSTSPPPAGMDISEMTKEQLAQKLFSYQQFMAKYIVDSQQQKVKAVATAEMKIKQQYEDKLKLLSPGSSPAGVVAVASDPVEAIPAFEQRSAKVAAAAAAGKSRWGDLENQRVGASSSVVLDAPTPPSVPETSSTTTTVNVHFAQRTAMVAAAGQAGKSRWGDAEVAKAVTASPSLPGAAPSVSTAAPTQYAVPPEVEAADHGLRADGGVGGPSLAERINFGAQLVSGQKQQSTPVPLGTTISASSPYFDKRNAMIVASGLAGKSRWGDMEIQKAQSLVASLPSSSPNGATIVVTPEIEAADHGLRADGGVGGPSLAQRVNLGAALVSK